MIIDSATPKRVTVPGSDRPRDPSATLLAQVDPSERVSVTVRLRPGAPIPDGYAAQDRATFEREHATRPADLETVDAFAHDYGLTVDARDGAQHLIALSGTAAQMQAAFGVDLARYRGADATYRSRTGAITLPEAVAPAVTGVFGLDDRPTSTSHAVAAQAPSAQAHTPLDIAKAYDFPSGDGTGEHVGVISLGGRYDDRVQAAYTKALGVKHVPWNVVPIDGGAERPSDPGPTGENTLDTEIIGALVPNADKTIYIAPNTDRGFLDAISTALHDGHHNTALSISWGGPEEVFAPQATRAFNELFKEAKAMGVSVFCAAGDNGSAERIPDGGAHVDFPSSSPSTIAVGGTKLLLDANGAIAKETVWNEQRTGQGATGGGISKLFKPPADQHGLGLSGRGVPDIAGDADPNTGYSILEPTAGRGAMHATVGGTSAVAPLYTALAARLEQRLGHPLGDFRKALYAAPADDFHDVTQGNNGAEKAGPGWDAASGRGSVDGAALLHDLQ